MKKIILYIGIIFLAIVIILNLIFTANLDVSEHITINKNSIIYILGLILTITLIYIITKIINKYFYKEEDIESNKKIRRIVLTIFLSIYTIFNIIWLLTKMPAVVGDQIHVCNLAQTFYSGNLEQFLPNMTYAGIPLSEYMKLYHQQIPLAFVYSIYFRMMHCDIIFILRSLNFIGNLLIIIALYKITNQLSKEHKTNKTLLFILILTFITLPMLSTFIYGDIPSLALCLFAVYFMMKYTETKKIKYPLFSSLCTMVAYMMRMNSLIFVIATVIYLILNIFKEFKQTIWKEKLINIIIIIAYILISLIPSALVKNYWLDKYNMDKNKSYPNISYILMAMEESYRGNGWYNESIGEPALRDPENAKTEYVERISKRLTYFKENIGYAFKFYIDKIASMWTENTYSAIRSNLMNDNDKLLNFTNTLTFYQKALLLVTCLLSLINIIQKRKNLSINIIFLLTIFIGGFAFHILWEAKSRYIIPYIVVLIPLASIYIDNKISKITPSQLR